jgi:hypothetical protein
VGKLEDAATHFHECGYAGAKCSYAGCGKVMIRINMVEHEATCQHRAERCGLCGRLQKITELAQHQLVCPKRQVDCDNHDCDARVAFDELAAHKANDCGYEEVGCPFADMGCTARILRKDIDSHEDAALKQHNRLLLGKAKEQQQINQQQEIIWQSHEELKQELEELKARVADMDHEVIIFRVKHAVLTGREPFVPVDPSFPTWIYSEEKVVNGHKLCIVVDTNDEDSEEPECSAFLHHFDGPVPCQVTWTFELLHYDGNPQSAAKREGVDTFTKNLAFRCLHFISKADLASRNNNPYVKDGYVTFKCTVKVVDE